MAGGVFLRRVVPDVVMNYSGGHPTPQGAGCGETAPLPPRGTAAGGSGERAAKRRQAGRETGGRAGGETPAAKACLMILETLQDPGNLGTILRAGRRGITGVVMNRETADIWQSEGDPAPPWPILRVPFVYADDLGAALIRSRPPVSGRLRLT